MLFDKKDEKKICALNTVIAIRFLQLEMITKKRVGRAPFHLEAFVEKIQVYLVPQCAEELVMRMNCKSSGE